jgi:hypothetical protein
MGKRKSSSASTSPASTATPAAVLGEMLHELRFRCPNLCPSVVPTGFADAESGVGLLGLCSDAAERRALAMCLQRARKQTSSTCAITNQAVADELALRFVSQWELQPESGVFQLKHCAFVCADAALLIDMPAMLERFTRRDADTKELSRLALLFSETNASEGEEQRSALEARLWLQECLTLASACQVLASSMPGWRASGPTGEPLKRGGIVAVAEAMLGVSADPSPPAQTPNSASSGKSRKARQREAAAAATAESAEPKSKAKKKRVQE